MEITINCRKSTIRNVNKIIWVNRKEFYGGHNSSKSFKKVF